MAFFEWKPLISVGIETIDRQHRVLIKYMNEYFESSMKDNVGAATSALNALLHYTRLHFEDEERMLAKNGYPEILPHKELHRDLLSQATRLAEGYAANPSRGRANELASFLRSWLMKHILGNDKRYTDLMVARGVK